MKATCNREGLLTALQIASGVVPPRTTKAILRNVKLELTGEQATLLATDLELGIHYRVSGVVVKDPGVSILPTNECISILRELPDETVEIEEYESGVRLQASSGRFELLAQSPDEFPDVPRLAEDAAGHKIKCGAFANMIRRTIFAVASENTRYALNSVRVEFEDDRALLISTDGKRLALMPGSAEVHPESAARAALIPPKALSLLQKVLLDPDEELEISLGENEALFKTGKVTVYSRLTEGRFPRFQDVIPAESRIEIPLAVGKFLGALRQAKIVTSEHSKGVAFGFANGMLTLESHSAERGASEVQLPIGYDGRAITITFDPQLLIDALRVLEPEEEVTLHLIDEAKAAVLRSKDDYAYVVMPLTRGEDR